jgi:hypothetical protein
MHKLNNIDKCMVTKNEKENNTFVQLLVEAAWVLLWR